MDCIIDDKFWGLGHHRLCLPVWEYRINFSIKFNLKTFFWGTVQNFRRLWPPAPPYSRLLNYCVLFMFLLYSGLQNYVFATARLTKIIQNILRFWGCSKCYFKYIQHRRTFWIFNYMYFEPFRGAPPFLVGQIFVQQNATACLSLRREHSSADGVSLLQPQPSGTRFHHIIISGQFRATLKTHRRTGTSVNFCFVTLHLHYITIRYATLHYID